MFDFRWLLGINHCTVSLELRFALMKGALASSWSTAVLPCMNVVAKRSMAFVSFRLHHSIPMTTFYACLQTTIMGATFEGGVVLAADSRTSTGNYVANRTAAKITQLAETIYLCRSGSAGDTQAVAGYVQRFLAEHEIEQGGTTPISVAASIVRQMIYANKGMLSAGLIVGGWDAHSGPQIYAIPLGGTLMKVCCFVIRTWDSICTCTEYGL